MSALSDKVAELVAAMQAHDAAVKNELQQLKDAIAANDPVDAIAGIDAVLTQMKDQTAALEADDTAPGQPLTT